MDNHIEAVLLVVIVLTFDVEFIAIEFDIEFEGLENEEHNYRLSAKQNKIA